MNYNKLLISLLVIFLVGTYYPSLTKANQTPVLNIITDDHKVLFNLNNLKPGDRAVRTLTIQNRGEEDFTYISDAKFKGGSEELFNEFLLEVSDAKEILYSGKMKDFKGFPPRLLKSLHEEELNFSVEFPSHLGNEFQGKALEVQFRFYIEDSSETPDPEDPETPGNPSNQDPDPEDSETPGNPGDPDPDPENPETPGNPSDPDLDPEDPDNTGNPGDPDSEDPDDSETPPVPGGSNPEDPENSEGSHTPKPQQPITPEGLGSNPVNGQILPATATNIYNFIAVGIFLIAAGVVILKVLQRRRILV